MCFLFAVITVHVCTCNFHYFHLRLISNVFDTSSRQSVVILGTPLTLTVETLDLEEDFPWRQMAFEKAIFVSGRYKRILLATPSSRMPLKSEYIWLIPWLILHIYIYIYSYIFECNLSIYIYILLIIRVSMRKNCDTRGAKRAESTAQTKNPFRVDRISTGYMIC